MDRLRCIEVFIDVARGRSFTATAQRLAMSRASVTKHVMALESLLGVQLLQRTTTRVSLTRAGESMLADGARLVEQYDQISSELQRGETGTTGLIRIGSTPAFGPFLMPMLSAFMRRYPELHVMMHSVDLGDVNLPGESIDVSFRQADALGDASYVAHALTRMQQMVVASPAYLERRGVPEQVGDLARHDCLVHAMKCPTSVWRFAGADGNHSVRVAGPLRANFGEPLRQGSLRGMGLSIHPEYRVQADLQAGRLVALLPEMHAPEMTLYAVVRQRSNLPQRLRVFLNFIKTWFADEQPWWLDRER